MPRRGLARVSRVAPKRMAALLLPMLAAAALFLWLRPPGPPAAPDSAAPAIAAGAAVHPANFVGNAICADCHQSEAQAWSGSHHALAMQHATPATVLGDFADVRLEHGGEEAWFLRRGEDFFVRTTGADGRIADWQVSYTIGFEPLQQYLVAMPDGRIQVLPFAWDSRPLAEGGQRWYPMYEDRTPGGGDRLHWTGPYQNWNWMCADCHTTKLERGYDPRADRFDTTWVEFNVGCESCHGPGSRHVQWAQDPGPSGTGTGNGLLQVLDERQGVSWQADASGRPVRSRPAGRRAELEACAQCHARRVPLAPGMGHGGDFLQTHEVALLDRGLYFADGQQREEVYEVGSFMQSKMHAAGVTCSDCHEPHSGRLRAPGDAVCGQCHAPSRYATPTHTLHAPGGQGSACVDCHMPARAYMGVDLRRDHAMRIPTPAASAAVGAPDACTGCHADRDASWAEAQLHAAHGPDSSRWSGMAKAFGAAEIADPTAGAALAPMTVDPGLPAIIRATALSHLRTQLSPGNVGQVRAALADGDPMVRAAAVDAMNGAPAQVRVAAVLPLAGDPSRPVRIKVAEALVGIDTAALPAGDRARLLSAFSEYEASRRANADRAEARVELGGFLAAQGRNAEAEAEFRAAMRLQPAFVPAYLGLSDLFAALGRDAEVDALLDSGLAASAGDAGLVHARGLLRIRQGRTQDAIALLGAAAGAAPERADFAFVFAVALHDAGRGDEAIATLESALARHPRDRALNAALEDYRRRAGAASDAGPR